MLNIRIDNIKSKRITPGKIQCIIPVRLVSVVVGGTRLQLLGLESDAQKYDSGDWIFRIHQIHAALRSKTIKLACQYERQFQSYRRVSDK